MYTIHYCIIIFKTDQVAGGNHFSIVDLICGYVFCFFPLFIIMNERASLFKFLVFDLFQNTFSLDLCYVNDVFITF